MRTRKFKTFACDFETTVYDEQENTEVWASASVELYTEDVHIFHSIDEQFDYFESLDENLLLYYHNLKFDGSFWLYFLLAKKHFTQALERTGDGPEDVRFLREKDMKNRTFKYSISDRGQWYSIIIKTRGHIIEIRDSLKLLPFSLRQIGESFQTKHKKLEMEYEGFRFPGCEITKHDKEYITNDVLVLKEALEIMFTQGHSELTIGSCCLAEYKKLLGKKDYERLFPDLYNMPLDTSYCNNDTFKFTVGDYIHRSYKGGWCYLRKQKASRILKNGLTADVNSLYPSMMSGESGNKYPYGKPEFFKGEIPNHVLNSDRYYYFVRIRTRFYIKSGYLPFIQIKGTFLYKGTECLETSDVYDRKTGKYYRQYIDFDGTVKQAIPILTMTCTDYKLFLEHYNVEDFEILDGCYFAAMSGMFDDYIEKYKQQKLTSNGAKRELAKLYLNNLYGKLAANTESSFKVARIKEDGALGYITVKEYEKTPGYIAVGSAITSYARNFTIRAAQNNYHGDNAPGFVYADTDSIHCDEITADQLVDIPLHDKNFCAWKLETNWDTAIFTRQKTYIEHVVGENQQPIERPWYNIKCAGMPDNCKTLFEVSLTGSQDNDRLTETTAKANGKKPYTLEEIEFLYDKETLKPIKRELTDFTIGLKIPGKLIPRNIRGGILLVKTSYEMRG